MPSPTVNVCPSKGEPESNLTFAYVYPVELVSANFTLVTTPDDTVTIALPSDPSPIIGTVMVFSPLVSPATSAVPALFIIIDSNLPSTAASFMVAFVISPHFSGSGMYEDVTNLIISEAVSYTHLTLPTN